MTDNTQLSAGVGGNIVSDEDLGGGVHLPRSKIVTGAHGVDGGDVGVSNPLFTAAQSLEFTASRLGAIDGHAAKLRYIIGSRSQGWLNTSALQDACEYLDTSQGTMNVPTTGQTLYIVSTSASDAAAGTGIRTVRIVYLDAGGVEHNVTVTMNGTSPVSLGSGFSAIQWMEADSVGSGGAAAGNIAITSTNGAATVATTFEYVSANNTRSFSGRYVVPSGYTGYLVGWSSNAISATMDARIRATAFTDDRTLSSVFHTIDRMYLASGENMDESLHSLSCPAGSTVKLAAIPGNAQAGNRLDTDFQVLLIAN